MKNLKDNRLGYEFVNALGHACKVTAYKSNKEVVVHDTATNKYHTCRWCDLHNPRCKAVYDATQRKSVETPPIYRKVLDEELVNRVRESENWCFADEVTSCSDDYDEDGNGRGCAPSVIVVGMLLAFVVLILGILLW